MNLVVLGVDFRNRYSAIFRFCLLNKTMAQQTSILWFTSVSVMSVLLRSVPVVSDSGTNLIILGVGKYIGIHCRLLLFS